MHAAFQVLRSRWQKRSMVRQLEKDLPELLLRLSPTSLVPDCAPLIHRAMLGGRTTRHRADNPLCKPAEHQTPRFLHKQLDVTAFCGPTVAIPFYDRIRKWTLAGSVKLLALSKNRNYSPAMVAAWSVSGAWIEPNR